MKKLRFQDSNSRFQDSRKAGLHLTLIKVSAKIPKLKNWKNTKTLQSLDTQDLKQDSKIPKLLQKNFKIPNGLNLIPAYLREFFLRLEPAPPPYTMESINTLQVVMGVTDLSSPRILKNKNEET